MDLCLPRGLCLLPHGNGEKFIVVESKEYVYSEGGMGDEAREIE